MNKNKENGDFLKKETRNKLIDAFIALTNRKTLDHISISELTTLAQINRGTFYLTYEDFNDFILSIEKELLTGFKKTIFDHTIDCGLGEGMVDVLTYIYDNMPLLKIFMLDQKFVEKVKAIIADYIQAFHKFNATIPIEYSRSILLNTTLSIIQLWIFEPQPKTVREVADIFYKTRTIAPMDLAI
ncbi:TetR/AcrR family transcriptional regulator [Pseudolactococcus plantarum]|uniref:Transcriptional regulator n=1 Tax=Pseudolactococcus plantarum TaxID=1365 RepID=A0A2A5S457_9LACT|nr:TetR/AcrR family transcriptional regulator [Lactococcus plantarum]PCS08307.1 transcriptional regulator [Lactococcus plantarum]HCN75312.1 TetR/AcrR family transcriptional regulator [Lactococcus sp.]